MLSIAQESLISLYDISSVRVEPLYHKCGCRMGFGISQSIRVWLFNHLTKEEINYGRLDSLICPSHRAPFIVVGAVFGEQKLMDARFEFEVWGVHICV